MFRDRQRLDRHRRSLGRADKVLPLSLIAGEIVRRMKERCALVLEPGKDYLIKARLTPVAQRHSLGSIPLLIDRLRRERQNGLATELVEAMVTTEMSFFRDVHPFESLKKTI